MLLIILNQMEATLSTNGPKILNIYTLRFCIHFNCDDIHFPETYLILRRRGYVIVFIMITPEG
jgi:hypothetical protein